MYCLTSTPLQVRQARFRAPELLFDPSLIGEECDGVHRVLHYAIRKSDLDLRRTLYQNIILSGGTTMFKVRSVLFGVRAAFMSLFVPRCLSRLVVSVSSVETLLPCYSLAT
jgi:hypothetical protein